MPDVVALLNPGTLPKMMKIPSGWIGLGFLLCYYSTQSFSGQISLAWDAVAHPEVGGYRIYYGQSSSHYTASIDVGNQTSYTLSGLEEGKIYYFAATTYNTTGTAESDFSRPVQAKVGVTTTAPETGSPKLLLIDSATNQATGIVIQQGSTLYLDNLDVKQFNLALYNYPAATRSVQFILSGSLNMSRIEDKKPYMLFGNRQGDYYGKSVAATLGHYSLQIKTYDQANAKGYLLSDDAISFSILPQSSSASPFVECSTTPVNGDNTARSSTGSVASKEQVVLSQSETVLLEAGEITVDHQWQRVPFEKDFINPVVVTNAPSLNDQKPAVVRVRNIDVSGFDIRLQDWDYLDDSHMPETIGYLVMERGTHTLADGTQIKAGRTIGNATARTTRFEQPFQVTPVILTTVTSVNERDAVTVRLRNIDANSFESRLQEQEANEQVHAIEAIDYIAWEPSVGTIDGVAFEVRHTTNRVTDRPSTITFVQSFCEPPVFLGQVQAHNGDDAANIRHHAKDIHDVDVLISEEQSADSETEHASEVVGYMVFSKQD